MEMLGGRLRGGVVAGAPFSAAGATVTPRAFSFVLRLPFGAWVWNTPVGVDVERNGIVERATIVDVTRWGLWGLTVLALLTGALGVRSVLQKGVYR